MQRLKMWFKCAVSVFRRFSTRYFGICRCFLRYCGIGYPPMSPSVNYLQTLINIQKAYHWDVNRKTKKDCHLEVISVKLTIALRCFDTVFQGPYVPIFCDWFSLSDRYKMFTSNWLWLEICENVVLSKIDITMTTINKKTLKAEFCGI